MSIVRELRISFVTLLVAALFQCLAAAVSAADARYDYDELGRLIRVVSDNTTTHYEYDEVGNLLNVSIDGSVLSPPQGELDLSALRCGETVIVELKGENLEGTRIEVSDPGLHVSDLTYTASGLSFSLTADCEETLGTQSLIFSNAAGSSTLPLSVDPQLPEVFLTPAPLAIPPDGSTRSFLLRLSHADNIAHTFQLVDSDPDTFAISTPSLQIEAGQVEVRGYVTGLQQGLAFLELASSTLGTTRIPVFVTDDFRGVNTSLALPLGLNRVRPEVSSSPVDSLLVGQAVVGISKGDAIFQTSPDVLMVGGGPYKLQVSGVGLDRVADLQLLPPEGLSVSGFTSSDSGESLELTVGVAEDAPTTLRRLILRRSDGSRYTPISPEADRIRIVLPRPELDSITPIIAYPGDVAIPITLRGVRLNDAFRVEALPSEGIFFSNSIDVNTAGTIATTHFSVAADADPGERVIVVTTPSGASSTEPRATNTLRLLLDTEGQVDNLAASMIGVLKAQEEKQVSRELFVQPDRLGLTKGAVITALEPQTGTIGTTVDVNIEGHNLSGVDSVTIEPSEGLTVSGLTVDPDGRSVSMQVTIEPDAPQIVRKARVMAGAQVVHPASPGVNRFLVTPPPPKVHAVEPLYLQLGSLAAGLTVYGENLQYGQMHITPADGIAIGSVAISPDGRVLTAALAVAESAETGRRVVQVMTPGGATVDQATPANSIYLVTEPGTIYPNTTSSPLGVDRLQLRDEPPAPEATALASMVGVHKQEAERTDEQSRAALSNTLGISKGSVITALRPSAALPGSSVELVLQGYQLSEVSSALFAPAEGIAIQQGPQINAEGTEVRLTVSLAPEAQPAVRTLRLFADDGTAIPYGSIAMSQFRVGYGEPEILSIEPILAGRGDVFTLLVRGTNLFDASVITAEPGQGIYIGNRITVNDSGTELTVPMAIDPNAPVGSHVIRVIVPGAVTTESGLPANTFTIYESVPN